VIHPDTGDTQWGRPSGNFEIGIALERTSFQVAGSIPVSVSIKNTGPQVASFNRRAAYVDDKIELYNSAGKLVLFRPHLILGTSGSGGSWDVLTLPPGQVQTEVVDLNVLYDLGSGNYTLRITRAVYSPNEQTLGNPSSLPLKFQVH
jgi:hypothetical protein